MERMQIIAKPRATTTKGQLRELRKKGYVPGVVYGRNNDPISIMVESKDIVAVLNSPSGANTLIDLEVDGSKATVLLKELQRDVLLADRFINVDFMRISLLDKLEVQVPVVLTGEAVGVKEGGVLQQLLREITLKCLATNIPEQLELDISELAVGESLAVADLPVPEGSEIITDAAEIVVTIGARRLAETEESEEGEAEAAADDDVTAEE